MKYITILMIVLVVIFINLNSTIWTMDSTDNICGERVNDQQDYLDGLLYDAVLDASSTGLNEIKSLLVRNANPNATFYYNRTVLHRAALCNSGVIQLLLDNGAGVNAEDTGKETPLHIAVCGSDVDRLSIVQALIGAGALVNAKNKLGKSPLQLAKNHTTNQGILKALKEAGAAE